jgi:hypothetical protein
MYQCYGVNNPVTKLLKVHRYGWYVHIIIHESPKWKDHGCQIGWSAWPWNVSIHLSKNVWIRYGGQRGNWVIPLTWECGGCYLWDCLSGRTNFNCCRSWSPTIDHIGETFAPICWTASKSTTSFWTKLFYVTRLPVIWQGTLIFII